ncbi:MAG: GSCFA domain-containing protein [Bacillota bacterium]
MKKQLYYHNNYDMSLSFFEYKKKNKKLKLLFMGACTTRNTCKWIQKYANEYIEAIDPWNNLFNPASILVELERINNVRKIQKEEYLKREDRYTDPIRTSIKGSLEEVEEENQKFTKKIKSKIQKADLMYINLGFAEVWEKNSIIYNRVPFELLDSPSLKNYMLKNSDLKTILRKIVNELKKIHNSIEIIFSIPYPPLKISGLNKNVLLSSFKSVEVLYKAINEEYPSLYYPEYEITQYFLNNSPFHIQDDGRHLSAELMDLKSRQLVYDLTKVKILEVFEDYSVIKLNNIGEVVGDDFVNYSKLEEFLSE